MSTDVDNGSSFPLVFKPPYIATQRLYKTKEGTLCSENDPNVAFLVAGENGKVPHDEAVKLGLVKEEVSLTKVPNAARKNATRGGD